MFNRIKKRKWVEKLPQLKELSQNEEIIKIRYIRCKILALECAKDFYTYSNQHAKRVASKYFKRYTNKAGYYLRKLPVMEYEEIFSPIVFEW